MVFGAAEKRTIDALLQAGYRYGASLAPREADAADLVHDAWLKLEPRHGRLPDKALLFRTIRHLYIDRLRHLQRFTLVSLDHHEASEQRQALPTHRVEEPPDQHLSRALDALRDVEREVLFLTVVEGYTTDEAAALTGHPRGTVLSLIHRARTKLRTALGGPAADAGAEVAKNTGERAHERA